MEFIDLKAQQSLIKDRIDAGIQRVLAHGKYILGPEVDELEERLAAYAGVKHCITVANGTDALQIAQMALGIGPGDEVIVPGFSYIATAETPVLLGAKPVYVDIDPRTYNISPAAIEAAITPSTKAIIPVSLYGQCADFDAINAIAGKHNIAVIEDGAQSFGADYKGSKSCGLSTIGCTSFFPSKPLGCYGDGGAILTNDSDLFEKAKMYRDHGRDESGIVQGLGTNSRLDNLQAAFLALRLKHFEEDISRRRQIAQFYSEILSKSNIFKLPEIQDGTNGNFNTFQNYEIEVKDRDNFKNFLSDHNIGSLIQWGGYSIIDIQGFEDTKSDNIHYDRTNKFFEECIMLPMHMGITDDQLNYMEKILTKYINEYTN